MRILLGTKVTEAPPGWQEVFAGRRVVVDLGAGDGRWAYESARADGASFYIAIDPDSEALAEYAFKASRKPARGGVKNACFVVASVEQLPSELSAIADVVRVNFAWGSLLRGLIEPQRSVLRGLASLLKPGGGFEIVLSYVPEYDPNAFNGEQLSAPNQTSLDALRPAYAIAGLQIEDVHGVSQEEALAIPSSWGRRLLHVRARPVFWLSGVKVS